MAARGRATRGISVPFPLTWPVTEAEFRFEDAPGRALARTDGRGLEEFLRAIGQSFADHARYANLLLDRPVDPAATAGLRAAVGELTGRAVAAGTVAPGITAADVMALVRGMRGLVQAAGEADPQGWPRFLDIHLAGMRAGARPA